MERFLSTHEFGLLNRSSTALNRCNEHSSQLQVRSRSSAASFGLTDSGQNQLHWYFWQQPTSLFGRWRRLQRGGAWSWGLDAALRQGLTWITPQTPWFAPFCQITMHTAWSQINLLQKELSERISFPNFKHFSGQPSGGWLPFNFFFFFSSLPPALSKVLGYLI